MEKDELRQKLIEAKQQYVDKNAKRLERIKPKWDTVQAVVPNVSEIQPYIEFCDDKYLNDLCWYCSFNVT